MASTYGANISNYGRKYIAGNSTFLWFLCLATNVIQVQSCDMLYTKHVDNGLILGGHSHYGHHRDTRCPHAGAGSPKMMIVKAKNDVEAESSHDNYDQVPGHPT